MQIDVMGKPGDYFRLINVLTGPTIKTAYAQLGQHTSRESQNTDMTPLEALRSKT